MADEENLSVKIVMAGSWDSGKTDLVNRFSTYWFSQYSDTQNIVVTGGFKMTVDDKECVVDIRDTTGQEEYSAMMNQACRTSDGFVCTFSIGSRQSFEDVKNWREMILRARPRVQTDGALDGALDVNNTLMILVGNDTTDLDSEVRRDVTTNEAEALAHSWGIPYKEVSKKHSDDHVNEVFVELIRMIMRRRDYQKDLYGELQESDDNKDLQSALVAYERAIQEGYVSLTNKKLVLMGPPCTGKTAFKALLFNWSAPKKHHSTAIASRPVRAIERVTNRGQGKIWDIVEPSEVYKMLADAIDAIDKYDEEHTSMLPAITESPSSTDDDNLEILSVSSGSTSPPNEEDDLDFVDGAVVNVASVPQPVEQDIPHTIDHSKHIIKWLDEKRKKEKDSKALHKATWVHVLDSGGQPQFADISRAFLRGNAVNIITIKLTERLIDKPRFTYSINGKVMNAPIELQMTNMQLIEHFVRSVGSAKSNTIKIGENVIKTKPFFIVIGTHYDKATKGIFTKTEITEEKIADKNHQLLSALGEFRDHFIFFNEASDELIFPVDNLCRLNRKQLSAQIRHRIMSQEGVGYKVPIPIRWYTFELQMRELASKEEHGIVPLQSCYDIGSEMKMDRYDVKDSLVYYDSLTLCLYYRKLLPNIVFTNPQYLLDMLSNVVRISFVSSLKDVLPKGQSLSTDAQQSLRRDGVFEESLLDKLGLPFVPPLFTKADFIKLLQHIKVIAPLTDCRDSIPRYFMPIVLPPEQLNLTPADKKMFMANCDPLIIEFKTRMVPQGIFPSLVVSLVSRNERPHFFIDSSSHNKSFTYQRRYAVKLYSGDLKGCVILIDWFSYIEVYFNGFPSGCPSFYDAIRNAIISSGKLLGYDVGELGISVSLMCLREDHSTASTAHSTPSTAHSTACTAHSTACTAHSLEVAYHEGQAYTKCTIEKDLPPVKLTDKQQCWPTTVGALPVVGQEPRSIPSYGILNKEHAPVILSAITEINSWEVLGIFLGLKLAVIEQIRKIHHYQVVPSQRGMIYQWLQNGTATSAELISALEGMGKIRTARQLPLEHSDLVSPPSNPNTTTILPEGILNEEHAPIILTVLGDDINDWRDFGLTGLGLDYSLLDKIRIENSGDVETCLMITIVRWLQKDSATREKLISALESGIENYNLASKIRRLPYH